jgi:hypothetical protein
LSLRPPIIVAVIIAAAACVPRLAGGQDERDVSSDLRLDDFRLSDPPALSLLGAGASSVARPNTPRALIASLVSATGASGLVPDGYAMETSPYWLLRHPALTLRDYYHASFGDRLRYFSAFSAATSRSSQRDTVPDDARVSIAARTLLVNGRPSRSLLASLDSMRAIQLAYITRYRRLESIKPVAVTVAAQRRRVERTEELLSTLVTKVLVGPERELRDSTLRTLERRDSARARLARAEAAEEESARIEKELDGLENRLSRLAERTSDLDAEPDGLTLELAAGLRALFLRGEWDRERSDGFGVWLTPMYRSANHLELVGVARYLTNSAEFGGNDLLDLGGRVGWDAGRAGFSAEWVRRSVRGTGSRSSARWTALFDYKLPAKLSLVASFGSDFRKRNGQRPVIATLGVNLGIGAVMLAPSR